MTIESNLNIGGQDVSGLAGIETDGEDRLGYATWVTTGDVVVPREWLLECVEKYGIPEEIVPTQRYHAASYKRAVGRLLDKYTMENVLTIGGQERFVEFDIRKGKRNVRYLFALVHEDEDVIEDKSGDAGKIEKIDLGHFNFEFDNGAQGAGSPRWFIDEDILGEPDLVSSWNVFVSKLREEFQRMRECHIGSDMRSMFYSLVEDESNAIPIRHGGVVYFFPEKYGEVLEGMAKIWQGMNDFKEDGHVATIVTMPVVDESHLRELIERHATEELNKRTDDILEAAIKQLTANEEETAEELAQDVMKEMRSVNRMADEYTQLLEVKLSVKRQLEKWLDSVSGEEEKERLVRKIIAQNQ